MSLSCCVDFTFVNKFLMVESVVMSVLSLFLIFGVFCSILFMYINPSSLWFMLCGIS